MVVIVRVTRLILINGPPGIGKSTLARRLAADHPLMLVVDIDEIRMSMGGWQSREESKLLARVIAIEMARAHLGSGHDVVVPQLLARPEFIEMLAGLADATGAAFCEIMLGADLEDGYRRLETRLAELDQAAMPHPLRTVEIDAPTFAETVSALRSLAASRPATRMVETATGDVEGAYHGLVEALGSLRLPT